MGFIELKADKHFCIPVWANVWVDVEPFPTNRHRIAITSDISRGRLILAAPLRLRRKRTTLVTRPFYSILGPPVRACAEAITERRSAMGIEQFIDNEVKSNEVVLFMKGTPQFPMCGFSGQVVQILDHLGVSYKGLNVLENDELRNGIKAYSNWPTIPQLYVKGEFVGGCDIVREMFQAGELQDLLREKGLAIRESARA
jgi:monothiol glutaredoxin